MFENQSKQRRRRIEEKIAQLKANQEIEAVEEIIDFDKTPTDLKEDMDRFVTNLRAHLIREYIGLWKEFEAMKKAESASSPPGKEKGKDSTTKQD